MKRIASLLVLASAAALATASDTGSFERHFVDATLRVDYLHVGDATTEEVTFDRLLRQGAWAGPRSPLVDPFGYGSYEVAIRDPSSGELLFSRGFDSYFGEYRTTEEAAAGRRRTYQETLLVPFPRHPVTIEIASRRRAAPRRTLGSLLFDPATTQVATEPPARATLVVEQLDAGDPHDTLDLVVVGEGYTAAESKLFRADLERVAEVLLAQEPFASRRDDWSLRGVLAPSADSGCDQPRRGLYRDTAVGASFNSLGSERYLLTESVHRLRDVAANVPYDLILVMVNEKRYGGGGIYNFYCVFTAHSQWSPYLLVHELGHAFAGLADEYYTSSVAYSELYPHGVEPVEPNITALLDAARLKWKELATAGLPIPTPWEKAPFDALDRAYQEERERLNGEIAEAYRSHAPKEEIAALEEGSESLSKEHAERVHRYLAASARAGEVGAFEGAGYSSTGLYRPMVDCVMFSKGIAPYCRVCQRAVAEMIDFYAGKGPRPRSGPPAATSSPSSRPTLTQDE